MRYLISVGLFLLTGIKSFGQVDITQYATEDLFKAKPVMSQDLSVDKMDYEVFESYFESELNKGLEYLHSNQLDKASSHFKIMTDVYPGIDVLHFFLGIALYEKGEYDKALASLNEALNINALLMEAKYYIGLIKLERGETKESKKIMKTLRDIPDYSAYGYNGMGLLALDQGNVYKAKRMFRKSIKEDSTFLMAYIPLSFIDLMVFGAIKPSLKRMNRAVEIDSTWQEARIIRAMISVFSDGNTEQFEKDLNILIKQDPENYHFYSIRGFLEIELKNYHDAVANFRTALNFAIDTLGEYKFHTRLKNNKSLKAALNYYYEKYDEFDKHTMFYIDRGICEFIRDNENEALAYYDSAYQNQRSPVVDYFKAIVYEDQWNKEKDAIHYYTRAIKQDSMNFFAYTARANLYYSIQEFDSAYNDLDKMIRLKPQDKSGYKMRGIMQLQANEYVKAYRDFTAAIMIDSTDNDLFFNRGTATFHMNYLDESIQDYQMVINRKPRDAESYYMLYLGNLRKGDTLKAITLLDSASKFRSYKIEYHKELLQLASQYDLIDNRRNALNRMVNYNPWEISYRFERGKFYYGLGEYEKAKIDLKAVVKLDKKHSEGHYYLGKTEIALGDDKSGRKSIRKAGKLGYMEK